MRKSIFFYKELTPAEVGKTGTHEVYVRLPNNFDYESFFGDSAVLNGSVMEVHFTAQDITNEGEKSTPLRFVYFKNSNQEKRIPSLGPLFKSHNVQEGDVVCLESRIDGTSYSYYLCFYKKGEIQVNPAAVYFSKIEKAPANTPHNSNIEQSLQQIFYGAPGTGKSFKIKTDVEDAGRIYFRTTFHPDSDYSTFVGCYKPTMDKGINESSFEGVILDGNDDKPRTKGNIIYSFTPQAFTNAYVKAWQTNEPVFLIIEEINRGNCAQIFGDLFQLLDRDENGYSQYKVDADADLADYIREHLINEYKDGTPEYIYAEKELKLQLPNNLYIWATMNTSDQSLFPIDSAFKRRWEWVYSPITEGKEKDGSKAEWQIEGQGADSWWKFIQGINEVIDITTHSEDKKLGFYFCKPTKKVNESDQYPKIITKNTFVNKVVFYLWNDVFKVYGFKSEIFDMKDENGSSKKITFKSFYKDNGSVNDDIVNVFVNNVMAKAPKTINTEEELQSEENETEA